MYVYDVAAASGIRPGQQTTEGDSIFDSIKNMFGGEPEQLSGPGYEESSGGFFESLTGSFNDFLSGFTGPTQLSGPADSGGGGGFFESIASGIGSLFGGFFANGGQIGAGKFGVVGENGPELVGGPASVTPMASGTNVTYNINAVDAQSFKAMIAADPSFIHGVAMMGARSSPARR
jgi:hypothetical protein